MGAPFKPTRAERRRLATDALLADSSRSDRSIARAASCSHTLVATIRAELEAAGRILPRVAGPDLVPQPHGGSLTRGRPGVPSPNTTHGTRSPSLLAPLRDQGERFARERWPGLDDARVSLIAGLMARVELAQRWLEERGSIVQGRAGKVYPIATALDGWSSRLEALITRYDAEQQQRRAADVELTADELVDAYRAKRAAADEAQNGEPADAREVHDDGQPDR